MSFVSCTVVVPVKTPLGRENATVPEIRTDVFGPDRMMYGSDWPVCLLAGSYKNILDIVKTYTADWNEEDKEKIFYKNAIQFYKLDA